MQHIDPMTTLLKATERNAPHDSVTFLFFTRRNHPPHIHSMDRTVANASLEHMLREFPADESDIESFADTLIAIMRADGGEISDKITASVSAYLLLYRQVSNSEFREANYVVAALDQNGGLIFGSDTTRAGVLSHLQANVVYNPEALVRRLEKLSTH